MSPAPLIPRTEPMRMTHPSIERNPMHTNHTRTLFVRLNLTLVTLLLAVGTMFAAGQATAAQGIAPQLLATQYFDALGAGTSLSMISPNAALHTP